MRKFKAFILKIQFSKQLLLGVLLLLLVSSSYAQQLPNYTQYLYNMQIINPAYVGTRAELSMSALSREQWVGLEGAPTTRTFSVNGRTRRGLGIGATFVNDQIGLSTTNNVNVDVSYTLITSKYSRLSFGLKGGLTFFDNNLANAITPDNEINTSISGQYPNVGFGAFFYNRKFYAGLSIPYILETPQFYIEDNFSEARLAKNANYFLTAGYLFELREGVIFKPSTMVRYSANLPFSIDLNANIFYKDKIEAGLSYRHQNSLSALFALIIKEKFRVGYAYDHRFEAFGGNFSTHEFILHIDINLKRNTRWLLSNKCYF
jgi:type IX secretion system PorP/SprF family membrane protein